VRLGVRFGVDFRVEDNLRDAPAVAEVDEDILLYQGSIAICRQLEDMSPLLRPVFRISVLYHILKQLPEHFYGLSQHIFSDHAVLLHLAFSACHTSFAAVHL